MLPSARLPMPGLLLMLGLVFAYNAYDDWTRTADDPEETPEEYAARQLKVLPDDVEQVMPDGRVLLKDGSIRRLG